MLRELTINVALGVLVVFSVVQVLIIIYTWYLRKSSAKFEADMSKYRADMENLLENETGPIPADFIPGDVASHHGQKLLREYIQAHCAAGRNPHTQRIREYADKTGLLAKLRKESSSGDRWKRASAMRILAEIAAAEDLPVFRKALESTRFKPVVLAAGIGLANIGAHDHLKLVITKLYNVRHPNRDEILSLVSDYYADAAEQCIELLEDSSLPSPLRASLVDVVGVQRARSAKDALEKILAEGTDLVMVIHLLEALEKIGDENSCSVILPFLKDEDFRCRLKAVNALERIAGDRYLKETEELLSDPDIFVRRNAAEAMSRMGGKGARSTPGADRIREQGRICYFKDGFS